MTEKKKPKPMTDMEYYHYCQRKGISHPDIEDRVIRRDNNGGVHYEDRHKGDSK